MKIVLTAGGSGGHFYPLIAVAEELNELVRERNLVQPDIYFLSNNRFDEGLLYQNGIQFRHVPAGKMRVYFSFRNLFDFLQTMVGLPTALWQLYRIYPDIVFSKGSYASVPVVYAAHLLHIPIFIHDSDIKPGRANIWAGKYATRVGVSYPDAVRYFPFPDRVACVGNPVRKEIRIRQTKDAHLHFDFSPTIKTILVVGGSLGAEHINNTLLQALPELLTRYQVIHQVGKNNHDAYKQIADVQLQNHPNRSRYKVFPNLTTLDMRMASGAADLIVSRAGSGSIFEIAQWELPAILVPIPVTVSRDQRENAYAYARAGGAEVLEQHNCTPHVLISEIDRLFADPDMLARMRDGAKRFQRPDAARTIAQEILRIAAEHERD
ncbi:MAG: undecaprenyldiphospho-muramoylpentapeptide beta-N-acetylglucosaminyltransferase [Candidatus Pacebacteria bacterium]|nr:undecaprenyldiphospho-muramoylpentapeptide beta-N-acetylglucosaminyltransferase [Candidatus Paceibacterota bacterium]